MSMMEKIQSFLNSKVKLKGKIMSKIFNNFCKNNIFLLLSFIINFTNLFVATVLYASDFYESSIETETTMIFTLSKRKEYEEFIELTNNLDYDPYTFEGSIFGSLILSECLHRILPDGLAEKLENMGATGQPSVIIIRGLPIDPEIPSFESDSFTARSDAKRTKVSESVIHALAGLMGYTAKIAVKLKL